jgi:hypothetical protein
MIDLIKAGVVVMFAPIVFLPVMFVGLLGAVWRAIADWGRKS